MDLSTVKFAYLESGQVPEGYVAGAVPGSFVKVGVNPPPAEVQRVSVESGVEDGEAEALLWYGYANSWYYCSTLSSFACDHRARVLSDGTVEFEGDVMFPG